MRFMLVIYGGERPNEADATALAASKWFHDEMVAKKQWVTEISLDSPSTATCVRVRKAQRQVVPEPAMPSAEQIVRCYLVNVPTQDEAVAIAKHVPALEGDVIEVRQIYELEGLPPEKPCRPGSDQQLMMLLSFDDEQAWNEAGEEALREGMAEAVRLTCQLDARGQYHTVSPLQASSTAASVRLRNGQRFVTDGPFVETREVLGGYYLFSVKSLDEAIAIAERHPGARLGTAELRPVKAVTVTGDESTPRRVS